jgi:hypothetical protein
MILGMDEPYLKMKLKLLTISSRAYSGRHLKASGCSEGSGSLGGLVLTYLKILSTYFTVLSGV